MKQFVNINGTNLIRDTENMAIINHDKNELDNYNKRRQLLLSQKNEINSIKDEISKINNDISEIKTLLVNLINK